MDVSEIRRRLNIAPQEGVAWFAVDESAVPFAQHKHGLRRVILREWLDNSPIACVFARSASSSTGLSQRPHGHQVEYPRCRIDVDGRIVIAVPVPAKKRDLDHTTAMCDEPDAGITAAVMGAESLRPGSR
ncbi:hypothetical protein GCM10023153_31470 [Ornithinibacter aureus]|uniref:Transposase n=1 Tax=Ornithinibacter aureus TaxID=622664 RepID=A0ABP8K8N9_9MICO|nr:hypothetical protein C8E84_1713 [Ornithinibacter aureus]